MIAGGLGSMEYYGVRNRRRDLPRLTRTERPRFIRAYYQLWSMLEIHVAAWPARLETMTLRQLFYLCEMTKLLQHIGSEEMQASQPGSSSRNTSHAMFDHRPSEKRAALGKKIWEHIECINRRVWHDDRMPQPEPWYCPTEGEGYLHHIVLWDHWQGELKKMVCKPLRKDRPAPEFERQYLWEECSEEESRS